MACPQTLLPLFLALIPVGSLVNNQPCWCPHLRPNSRHSVWANATSTSPAALPQSTYSPRRKRKQGQGDGDTRANPRSHRHRPAFCKALEPGVEGAPLGTE
ncbi:hypothetical protein LZ30DRAFT_11686 [Colletotrichum cereale]|nr:hypothetical protein LZ30DRAFT_11686 [Colletotrichum cereale]